ncbi:MAG: proton-translocating transhydrogenase family protein, partial [Bifidobacteriaceae bacterium]|nr:proton-translocating transhydrogenase family protein [Bifidobacteriaceae bacterium]
PGKDGQVVFDWDDVVQRGVAVVTDGAVTWPPPPVAVSAAPAQAAPAAAAPVKPEKKPRDPRVTYAVAGICAAALLALFWVSPSGLLGSFMVFMLSVVIGYYVIGNVSHSLHTPLMSVTNAISGIIIVGSLAGLTQSQSGSGGTNVGIVVLAVAGILLASINVFGGFTVTQRMLKMFKKG